jgi:hypothetical protein
LFLISSFFSCVETLPDEELTMVRMPYNGSEIRLDGCFISEENTETHRHTYSFFYSNGTELSFSSSVVIEQKNQVPIGVWSSKLFWGVFEISDKVIKVQSWDMNEDTFVRQFIRSNYIYKILNDSTLLYENSKGYKLIYHFKKFSPKPDSTNIYIR